MHGLSLYASWVGKMIRMIRHFGTGWIEGNRTVAKSGVHEKRNLSQQGNLYATVTLGSLLYCIVLYVNIQC